MASVPPTDRAERALSIIKSFWFFRATRPNSLCGDRQHGGIEATVSLTQYSDTGCSQNAQAWEGGASSTCLTARGAMISCQADGSWSLQGWADKSTCTGGVIMTASGTSSDTCAPVTRYGSVLAYAKVQCVPTTTTTNLATNTATAHVPAHSVLVAAGLLTLFAFGTKQH